MLSANDAAAMIQKAVRKSIRDTGRGLGTQLGKMAGKPGRGARIGKSVAARVSKLMGSGDYTSNSEDVSQNSLFKNNGSSSASFSDSSGGVRIKHREYVQDIINGTTNLFSNNTFIVNPGLGFVFPYLAQIAANFEQYKFHGLVFEFVSSVSPYQASGLGTYVMAMAYNASAPSFTSKPAMENSDYALSVRMDGCGMYGVECAPSSQAQEYYYVRAPGVVTPVNLTDLGLMQFATVTPLATNATLGELWVSYDIELIRPRIALERYGYAHITTTGVTAAAPLGTATTKLTSYGALVGTVLGDGTVAAGSTGTQISFPNASVGDVYMFTFTWVGTAVTAPAYPAITLRSMVNGPNLFSASTTNISQPNSATGAVSVAAIYIYQVSAEQPLIPGLTLGVAGAFPAGATLDLLIQDIGNGWSTSTL